VIPPDDRVLLILWMDRKIQNDEVVVVDVCYFRGNRRRMGVEDVGHEVAVVVDDVVVDVAAVGEMDDSLDLILHVVVEHVAFESVVVGRHPCDDDGDGDGDHHMGG